jgi:murein DD-endopeptidase MepM/ murein hydrolase activator NlpD
MLVQEQGISRLFLKKQVLYRGRYYMDSIPEGQEKEKVNHPWLQSISAKWIALLAGLLIILLAGAFAKYHQTSGADSVTVTKMEPALSRTAGPSQEAEKTARSTDKLANKPSIWPTSGEVTSGFGWRKSPWGGGNEFHPGIDIANIMETPIVATADGKVVQSEWSDGYGNIVKIDHGNGLETLYGHNSRIIVSVGQLVRKGEVISYLGSTGRSTGPHVHYEIRANGTAVDPISFLVQY